MEIFIGSFTTNYTAIDKEGLTKSMQLKQFLVKYLATSVLSLWLSHAKQILNSPQSLVLEGLNQGKKRMPFFCFCNKRI